MFICSLEHLLPKQTTERRSRGSRLLISLAGTVCCLVLHGCDNCADGAGTNKCFEEHCPEDARFTVCRENGVSDNDCCGLPGTTSCDAGYVHVWKDTSPCYGGSAYTTCCVPTEVASYYQTRPKEAAGTRWWIVMLGFIFGFGYCCACIFGCAVDDPLKNAGQSEAKGKVWGIVIVICLITAIGFHAGLGPNAQSKSEREALNLAGGIGDLIGLVLGIVVWCFFFKPWLVRKLRGEQRVSAADQHGSEPAAAPPAAALPPLSQMVDAFRRELALDPTDDMSVSVDAACEKLNIDGQGKSLVEKAELCWRAMYGDRQPLAAPFPLTEAVVVGSPVPATAVVMATTRPQPKSEDSFVDPTQDESNSASNNNAISENHAAGP
eukprot:TRINITY_DN59044_c0_g1_i1.p1 TRINITY_DN59044_c0_g1~~TRINITY_DN59044_c0_g1_i1.p1  ORF type:complete len:379 (+),score=49.20 TRINITY_DN59044_c0_g1_i1:120-1256(+)